MSLLIRLAGSRLEKLCVLTYIGFDLRSSSSVLSVQIVATTRTSCAGALGVGLDLDVCWLVSAPVGLDGSRVFMVLALPVLIPISA